MSREIDLRIIREVMQLDQSDWREDAYPCIERRYQTDEGETVWHCFSPSEDASDAMEVVERMKSLGFSIDADNFTGTKENPWSVRFGRVAGCWDYDGSEEADTFCKAVCLSALAALRAVGGEGGRT